MSLSLRVGQLIYTRVEAAFSPQRKSGFQTVCHSTSLTASAVQAIEQRVQCFQQQADIVRWQFFRLDSGAFVLTHTCLLTRPDTTITDATGRSGAFLVHGLVLTPEQFATIDYNPWAILTAYPFQYDPQSMLEHIAQTAEDGHHTQVTPHSLPTVIANNASATAQELVALARQAHDVTRKGQSLLLVGSAEAITDVLRTAFALMPRQQRSACSFDTCIDRCASRPGLYWMVGASTRPYSGNYLYIELREPHGVFASGRNAEVKGMLAQRSPDEGERELQPEPEAVLAQRSPDEGEREPQPEPEAVRVQRSPDEGERESQPEPEAVRVQRSMDEGERGLQPDAVLTQSSTDEPEREPQPEAELTQRSPGEPERELQPEPEVVLAPRSPDDASVRSARVRPRRSSGRTVMSGRPRARGVQRRSRPNPALVSRRNKASVWAWLLSFLFGLLKRR